MIHPRLIAILGALLIALTVALGGIGAAAPALAVGPKPTDAPAPADRGFGSTTATPTIVAKWIMPSHGVRVLVIEDHAPAGWYVRRAVATWDVALASKGARLIFRYGTCTRGDILSGSCIKVVTAAADRRVPSAVGGTDLHPLRGDFGIIGWVGIALFTKAGATVTPALRCTTVMHEMGHALGLVHTWARNDLMRPALDHPPVGPSAGDVAAVVAAYR